MREWTHQSQKLTYLPDWYKAQNRYPGRSGYLLRGNFLVGMGRGVGTGEAGEASASPDFRGY